MSRAAGSRSWAAVRAQRGSRVMRARVAEPRSDLRGLWRSGDTGTRRAVVTPAGDDERLAHVAPVELEDAVEQRLPYAGEQLERLERLDRPDDPGHRPEHARFAARGHRAGRRLDRERAAVAGRAAG